MRVPTFVLLSAFLLAVLAPAAGQVTAPDESESGTRDSLRRLPLDDLEAFEEAGPNWSVAGRVGPMDWTDSELPVRAGTGVLVNRPSPEARSNLTTRLTHGDLHLRFEVLVPRGSNSGVYLQGRYEIQILDSWGVRRPTYGDMGGVYHRWDPTRAEGGRGYQGHAPRVNVARAPGLWQEVEIVFRAPRFDESGAKIARARIDRVVLNGVVIHRDLELTGPTRGGHPEEVARGPVLIQGDHGPVAFRNVRYRVPPPPEEEIAGGGPDPIRLEPGDRPLVQRGFAFHGEEKRTHVASVGHPGGPHAAIDLETGAPLYLWRGPFVETTSMWQSRGRDQVARPRGSTVVLSGGPAFPAVDSPGGEIRPAATSTTQDSPLSGEASPVQDDLRSLGYDLDPEGRPVFRYRRGGRAITDRWEPALGGRALERRVVAAPVPGPNAPASDTSSSASAADSPDSGVDAPARTFRHLIAEAATVRDLGDGRYLVGDRAFFVALLAGENVRLEVRETPTAHRLVAVGPPGAGITLRYRYVW